MEIKNTVGQINPYRTRLDQARTGQTARTARGGQADEAANAAPKGDTVTLSPEAKLRTEAYAAAMDAPDVRRSKVDEIKSRIASGEYQADSRRIAGKLLAEEPGLFEI
jgi:negative regulator of flagellin synthesis FlgM